MKKNDFILACLSSDEKGIFTPVQVQKLFFILDQKITVELLGEKLFNFEPYSYGPFDQNVYNTMNELQKNGFIDIIKENWNIYKLTNSGKTIGKELLDKLERKEFITKLTNFITSLSFSELVKAVYKAYPDMKVNSIFKG